MTLQKLDFIFPFFVFFYGIIIVFVVESSALKRLALDRKWAHFEGLMAHKGLAWICFWVGGLWSLQNLMF